MTSGKVGFSRQNLFITGATGILQTGCPSYHHDHVSEANGIWTASGQGTL